MALSVDTRKIVHATVIPWESDDGIYGIAYVLTTAKRAPKGSARRKKRRRLYATFGGSDRHCDAVVLDRSQVASITLRTDGRPAGTPQRITMFCFVTAASDASGDTTTRARSAAIWRVTFGIGISATLMGGRTRRVTPRASKPR